MTSSVLLIVAKIGCILHVADHESGPARFELAFRQSAGKPVRLSQLEVDAIERCCHPVRPVVSCVDTNPG